MLWFDYFFSIFVSLFQIFFSEPVCSGLLCPAPDSGNAGVQAGTAGRFWDCQLHYTSYCSSSYVWLVNVR